MESYTKKWNKEDTIDGDRIFQKKSSCIMELVLAIIVLHKI